MIGLDTGAVMDIVKGSISLKKKIEDINEPLSSTIMNYQEIMFGFDFSKDNHLEEEKIYDEFFDSIHLISFTRESSKKAARLFKAFQQNGKDIGKFDCIIAGILLENGINKIITKNARHFERIKGIEVISY